MSSICLRLLIWLVLTDDNHEGKLSLIPNLFLIGKLAEQMQLITEKEKHAWQWLHRGNAATRSFLSKTNTPVPSFTSLFARFHQLGKVHFGTPSQSTAAALWHHSPTRPLLHTHYPEEGATVSDYGNVKTTTHHFCSTSRFPVSMKLVIYTSSEYAHLFLVLKPGFLLPCYVTIFSALLMFQICCAPCGMDSLFTHVL